MKRRLLARACSGVALPFLATSALCLNHRRLPLIGFGLFNLGVGGILTLAAAAIDEED